MSDAPSPRKRSSELVAAVLFLCATVFLTFTVVKQRLDRRPAQPAGGNPSPFGGTWLSASDHEGVKIIAGTGHTILVDSTPPAATVFIDDARAGETPWAADLACVEGRRRVLEVKLKGYETSRYEIDCIQGSTHVSTKLKKQ